MGEMVKLESQVATERPGHDGGGGSSGLKHTRLNHYELFTFFHCQMLCCKYWREEGPWQLQDRIYKQGWGTIKVEEHSAQICLPNNVFWRAIREKKISPLIPHLPWTQLKWVLFAWNKSTLSLKPGTGEASSVVWFCMGSRNNPWGSLQVVLNTIE